ncbi:MAG TPA: sensor domain-containing diguanylate cyclase [Pseudomonadales bacterium]|jgi:diguanylate cyclase (GGDEF)-like protein|nr:sensor domain-containing diguanylate cyclase [Pseudomonadales bacterium]HNB83841.1 sensor domain-containing diguanylate cyclase [Pseudomonadales bacterium]HNF08529.1 sensor domain-containing diguanylate cyclase [Pseudomonadales bacterium]HNH19316.1 sensor domain-containing diguanylate cyclase [Pseudomonadales bacterium]HNH70606.1 sensor domain-containing diguanylate cyclase [Pseudomonadales bacterium]
MTSLNQLLDNLRTNETLARKIFEIESEVLAIYNSRNFFDRLLALIQEKFGVPEAWVALIDEPITAPLIHHLSHCDQLTRSLVPLSAAGLRQLSGHFPDAWLVSHCAERHNWLIPPYLQGMVRSMAVTPLQLEGRLIGALVQGDRKPNRWDPSMDTFFLSQLTVKVSLYLANLASREQLEYLATRDALTGLYNRREFDQALEREISRAQRSGAPLCAIFIDCNDFKQINDTHGHDAGDAVLRHLAQGLEKLIRRVDCAFRYAGDEFVLLLPGQRQEQAQWVAQRLDHYFRAHPCPFRGQSIPYSISCGVASTEQSGIDSGTALLKQADMQLYQAKGRKHEAVDHRLSTRIHALWHRLQKVFDTV